MLHMSTLLMTSSSSSEVENFGLLMVMTFWKVIPKKYLNWVFQKKLRR
uniref:Alternative protein MMP13 n=1 Tax=Homo sapiens TaxID=9606 RepID=L8EA04_HUMAN|nr:alternative protein MMP13 [Homo sapiens]